ncbi:MAG TPA: dTDP-4-keto-6-deoxy-D-glucose epimerase [Gallicola sp.]|nr:dTDP-4-keto-6-deoxy-D-glucose epimerase [Gallicola sp.]
MIQYTDIEGLLILDGFRFNDLRGSLIKPYSKSFFKGYENKINLDIKETWFTKSHKNVIRGMHLQVGEFACEKIVSVIQGKLLDVILDIRKTSKTYGKVFEIELNEDEPKAIYIPVGCAHGYKVLEDNTMTMYMATEINVPKCDVGIRWNSFNYDWKIEKPIISEKDLNLPLFNSI